MPLMLKLKDSNGKDTVVDKKKLVLFEMTKLCEEVRSGMTQGMMEIRLRQVIGKTRYSYLLKPVAMGRFTEPKKMMKYIYDVWLIVQGLKVSKY